MTSLRLFSSSNNDERLELRTMNEERKLTIMDCLLLINVVQLLVQCTSAAPTGANGFFNPVAAQEVLGIFRVHGTATDLAVVGHHVIGDVTVEIEALRSIDLQVQWSALVETPSSSSQNVAQHQQQMYGTNSSDDSELQLLPPQPSTANTYMVPIVGDSWCSIQETSWFSADNSRKHLTSTLNCRHLPSTTTGKNHDPGVVVVNVKALDGVVQYQRHLTNNDAAGRQETCFDWRLPDTVNTISRTRLVQAEERLTLNFSVVLRCDVSSLPSVRLGWISDNTVNSLDWVAVIGSSQASTGNESEIIGCHMREQFARIGNSSESEPTRVYCNVATLPDEHAYEYTVQIDIKSADRRRHSGTFSVSFSRDDTYTESVTLFADLVVVADADVDVVDRKDSIATVDARALSADHGAVLRMRTCSDTTSGPWWFSDGSDETRNLLLRSSVPDCVLCAAQWNSLSSDRYPLPSPPEVRIIRADGLILGSEESHSVYWYQEPGGRASVAVLLLRAPSDEYTGDYICSTSAFLSESTKTGSDSTRSTSRKTNKAVDELRSRRKIKFRLTVLP